jgi:ParB/RepB/Spo0J family partition protein
MRKIELRPLDWFKPDPSQPRKHFDEEELLRLGESLKIRQNDPAQAQPDGMIVDGERRWRAAKLVGLEKLEVIVTDKPLSTRELTSIRLNTFFNRSDLKPHERCRAVAEFMEQNPDLDQAGAARELGVAPATITHLLAPKKCIPAVQEAFVAAKLTISDCYAISKLPHADQPGLLALKLSGASRDDLERQGRKTRSASVPAVRASKLVICLGGGVKVTICGCDLSLDDAIDAVKDAQREMTKGRDLGLDAKTIVSVARDKAKAGA